MMTKVYLMKTKCWSKPYKPKQSKLKLGEGLVLAAGGCGHAAKGADEIGETFRDEIGEDLWDGVVTDDWWDWLVKCSIFL